MQTMYPKHKSKIPKTIWLAIIGNYVFLCVNRKKSNKYVNEGQTAKKQRHLLIKNLNWFLNNYYEVGTA